MQRPDEDCKNIWEADDNQGSFLYCKLTRKLCYGSKANCMTGKYEKEIVTPASVFAEEIAKWQTETRKNKEKKAKAPADNHGCSETI